MYCQDRLLQFSSHGHSELCNSTDAESPKYCCTPQSELPLIFLSCYTFTVLPALSALRQTHRHAQNPTLQRQNPWLSHFLTLWPPHLEQSSPKTSGTLLLSVPSKANSRHFSSQNISVKPHWSPSLLSVCTVCVCVYLA